MSTIAFIFARGGSKGVLRKNLQKIGPHSLVARAVRSALSLSEVKEVVISSDDEQIIEEAKAYGASFYFLRPRELAEDGSSEWDAWRHAVSWYLKHKGDFDKFLSVPPTAPLRTRENLLAILSRLDQDDLDFVLTGTPSAKSPYFNQVRETVNGEVTLFSTGSFVRRQDVPPTYDLTTVGYGAKPRSILKYRNFWEGRSGLVTVAARNAIDIDTPLDLLLARAIYHDNPPEFDAI